MAVGAGRVVLVTGGNRGIGRAVAAAFAAGGDRVAVTTRSGEVEDFFSVPCDVTDTEAVDKAVGMVESELGPIEVLVANAGINDDKLLLQMDEESFARVLDTNLVGAFRVVRRALPKMLAPAEGPDSPHLLGRGAFGRRRPSQLRSFQSGLDRVRKRSLAREIGGRSITVNVVAPGFIETDMTARLSDERRADVLAQVPLKRFGMPDEVAGVVRWLASEDAGYVTGSVVPVDGGLGMGH